MKTPTLLTRLLGTPVVAVFVCLVCAVIVVGWMNGQLYWLWALAALCLGGKTFNAVLALRRYERWFAAWQAMNNAPTPGAAAPKRKANTSGTRVAAAGLTVLLLPAFIAAPGTSPALRGALTLLWLGIAVYLLCKIATAAIRRARIGKGAGTVSAGDDTRSSSSDTVKLTLPRASSSPSRAEATRNLPDYCSRLMASH